MAFYNEEYSKACRLWIDDNGEFYRHFTDAVKQLRLSGMLHVYDFELTNLQGRPQSIKVGDYGEIVWDNYEKIHSVFGVRSLISWPISSSWFEKKEEYVYAATSWLIHGDFYDTLVLRSLKSYKLEEYDNKEVSLGDLITPSDQRKRNVYSSAVKAIANVSPAFIDPTNGISASEIPNT